MDMATIIIIIAQIFGIISWILLLYSYTGGESMHGPVHGGPWNQPLWRKAG